MKLLNAFLLIFACCLGACQGGADDVPPPAQACLEMPIEMEGDGSVAMPPACMKGCMKDAECTVVNASCPGCCEHISISKSYLEHYQKFAVTECRKYHGLECGCNEKPGKPSCIDNICSL